MSFQSSLSGINVASERLDVIGVNVANAQTVGFKETSAKFADIIAGRTGSRQVGTGALSMTLNQHFAQGDIHTSGNEFDVAINGKGFFQVQEADGTLAYTRNGQFHTNKDNYLVTPEGDKVMGTNGPIQIDVVKYGNTVSISADGKIQASDGVTRGPDKVVPDPNNIGFGKTITVPGDLVYKDIAALQLHDFRNHDGMVAVGANKWKETNASGAHVLGAPGTSNFGLIQAGAVEQSNADLNTNLVNMIVAQREYQGNAQALKIQNEMDLNLIRR